MNGKFSRTVQEVKLNEINDLIVDFELRQRISPYSTLCQFYVMDVVIWITVRSTHFYLKEKILGVCSRNMKKQSKFVFLNNFNSNETTYSMYRTAIVYVVRRWKIVFNKLLET
jgi:hypothetical protein